MIVFNRFFVQQTCFGSCLWTYYQRKYQIISPNIYFLKIHVIVFQMSLEPPKKLQATPGIAHSKEIIFAFSKLFQTAIFGI